MPLTPKRLSEPAFRRTALAALMLLVLAAGAVYSRHLGPVLRFGDEVGYYDVAHNLRTRGWYSEDGLTTTAYRAPGYPLVLCALMWLGVGIPGMRVVNFLALAGSLAVADALLRRHGYGGAGLLAAVMLAAYPVLFYTAGTLYPQTLGVFFLLLTVLLASRDTSRGGNSWRACAEAGAASGFLVLLIPSMLPMLPVFALLPRMLGRARPGRGAAIFLAGAALLVAPWTLRNAVAFHRFIPISTNGGINLLLGNSEHAGPDTGYMADISRYTRVGRRMNELDRDTFYRRAALAWIAHHKARAAALYVGKFLNDFDYHNRMDTGGVTSEFTDVLLLVSYGPLLLLWLLRWGLARAYPPSPLERFLALAYLASALLTALFFTRIRFRLPFDALLICADAVFLRAIWRSRRPGMASGGENPVTPPDAFSRQ